MIFLHFDILGLIGKNVYLRAWQQAQVLPVYRVAEGWKPWPCSGHLAWVQPQLRNINFDPCVCPWVSLPRAVSKVISREYINQTSLVIFLMCLALMLNSEKKHSQFDHQCQYSSIDLTVKLHRHEPAWENGYLRPLIATRGLQFMKRWLFFFYDESIRVFALV